MGTIIAQFADGRFLYQEEKAVEQGYKGGGIPFRITNVKTIEAVLSIDACVSGQQGVSIAGVATPLKEASISGDTIAIVMRREDNPLSTSGYTGNAVYLSGLWSGGPAGFGYLSGITSGLPFQGELTSGLAAISGFLRVVANVIAY